MRKTKKFSIILVSIITIFNYTVFAQVPNFTVVIGDKAYSMSYANKSENFKEIFNQINEADGEIYIKTNGKWYENSSGKQVSPDVIKLITYKDGKGKVHDYTGGDGEEILLEVTRVNFINSNEIEISFNKSLDKEAAENKDNYKIGEASLGENDKVMLKKDSKTVIVTLNEEIKDKSECNIIVSKNITDLNKGSLKKEYSYEILLLSKEKTIYNSVKDYKNDLNIISNNSQLKNCKLVGNLYIGGDEITIENVSVKGTIYVDPGERGSANIKNVQAENIVILSGAEKSIHLNSVKCDKLEVDSDSKVRVESKGSTAIGNTVVHTYAIIDSVSGSFGEIIISFNQNSKDKTIELKGTFKEEIIVETGVTLKAAKNANIAKVVVSPINKKDEIKLSGNLNQVEVNKESNISLVKCQVKRITTNEDANLYINKDSKVKILDKKGHKVVIEGEGMKNISNENKEDTSSRNNSSSSNGGSSHSGGSGGISNSGGNSTIPEPSEPTVSLSVSNITVEVGKIVEANVQVTTGAQITYSSNNDEIASIDANGTITGLKGGKANIEVRATKSGYKESTETFVVTVTPDRTKPIVTAIASERLSSTTGTAIFISNEIGEYYTEAVAKGKNAPSIDTTGSGIACGTTETTATVSLTNAAQDVYIVVKDGAGNVSDAVKIEVPEYTAPDTTKPIVTVFATSRLSHTRGTILFTSNEAGQYYTEVVAKGEPAPTIDTTGVGIDCDTAKVTASLRLTAGTKDVYIVVKDAAGNVSDPVKAMVLGFYELDLIRPIVTPGEANRTSDTEATVKFTSSEDGKYYIAVVAKGEAAPRIDTTGVGTDCDTTEVTASVTLTAGAQDVYIVVLDLSRNPSNPVKIEIPEY